MLHDEVNVDSGSKTIPWTKIAIIDLEESVVAVNAVDLTCQHKNQTLLVEGPEIKIRPVGNRRVTGGSRWLNYDHH